MDIVEHGEEAYATERDPPHLPEAGLDGGVPVADPV